MVKQSKLVVPPWKPASLLCPTVLSEKTGSTRKDCVEDHGFWFVFGLCCFQDNASHRQIQGSVRKDCNNVLLWWAITCALMVAAAEDYLVLFIVQ
jgi:hypothetical protein